jgi:hypothetical protein
MPSPDLALNNYKLCNLRMPPGFVQQHARGHRRHRHRQEYEKIVRCLGFGALRRSVTFGGQRRAAYLHETPADAEQVHRSPEMPEVGSCERGGSFRIQLNVRLRRRTEAVLLCRRALPEQKFRELFARHDGKHQCDNAQKAL